MQGAVAPRGFGKHSAALKRKRWGGLRRQWELLGLFEIDQHHEFYSLTCMMKEGLFSSIQTTIDPVSSSQLVEEDFRAEDTQIHKGFTWETFAGPVFANLRGSLGVTEQEYQRSLCSDKCYLQFISNSKSKADFFLTNDKRFFLKTQNEREIRFLLENLKNYVAHLQKYPHSLLVKLLGVHRIKISCRQKKYFIVMQSVFYPDDRISARYDIKGCEVSRWTDPSPDGCQIIVVLKDLNFEGQYITLERQRYWLLRQMEIDTEFLRSLNVLDYSLLLAHQPLQQDERHHALSFASLIVRTKRSVNPSTSPAPHGMPCVPGAVPEDDATCLSSEIESDPSKRAQAGDGQGGEAHHLAARETEGLSDSEVQNRRLLLNLKNALHVIDGPEQRYFIGIIDIFTVYSLKKRLEYWWKRLRHPGRTFSTVSQKRNRSFLLHAGQNNHHQIDKSVPALLTWFAAREEVRQDSQTRPCDNAPARFVLSTQQLLGKKNTTPDEPPRFPKLQGVVKQTTLKTLLLSCKLSILYLWPGRTLYSDMKDELESHHEVTRRA